jgi:hypothetical protein
MATRSPGSSSRPKKSTPDLPPVINLPDAEQQHADSMATDSRAADGIVDEAPGNVQITRSKLQQREIPSFSESREARIAEAAYWRAERRGFTPGNELDDWLHAEKEVDDGKDQGEAGK